MGSIIKNLLEDQGYNLVALPRTGIKPLLLLVKDGNNNVQSLESDLTLLFEPDVIPLNRPISKTAPLSGKKNITFDFKSGMSFLSSIFNALKLNDSKLKANASADHSYTVDFSFNNIIEDNIGLLDLDNFLSGAIPKKGEFITYERKLKQSMLYVITSTLRSNEFSIKISNANGQSIDVDASVDKVGDIKVDFSRKADDSYTIKYSEEDALTFGFKAAQIKYDKAKWFEFWNTYEAYFRIIDRNGLVLRGDEKEEEITTDLDVEDHAIEF